MTTRDTRPRYRQIAAEIEADIAAGRLTPGQTVPSIAEIQRTHDVGLGTAQAAIRYLTAQGVVETVHGSGTFVRKDRLWVAITSKWWTPQPAGSPDLWTVRTRDMGRDGTQKVVFVGPADPPDRVRVEMGLDDGETAILRDRVLYLDGKPVQIARSFYPHDIADGTPLTETRRIRGGAPSVLSQLADPPVLVHETTHARMPDGAERATLEIPDGVPVMDLLLCASTARGRVVEVAVNVVRGDVHRLRYEHDV